MSDQTEQANRGIGKSDMDRFWSHVDRSGGPDACWPYTGFIKNNGYGQFWLEGQNLGAHRVAYMIGKGPLGSGLCACHDCDQRYPKSSIEYRRCCNPAHLFAGTTAENMADRNRKGRQAVQKGDLNGLRRHPERAPRTRGEQNGSAKVTVTDVIEIRARAAIGESRAALSREFKLSDRSVGAIVLRQTWTHV